MNQTFVFTHPFLRDPVTHVPTRVEISAGSPEEAEQIFKSILQSDYDSLESHRRHSIDIEGLKDMDLKPDL